MTDWLAADEAPGGFTDDQDTELRATRKVSIGNGSIALISSFNASSAFEALAASTTSQPLTGSIHTQVVRRMLKARGSNSSATCTLSSRICFLPVLNPCCSSSSAALALAT